MIIEGENLEVLKLLTSAYREQIKCIYIDPPYNTGGDFIYPDNYAKNRKEYWEDNGSYKEGVKLDTNPETSGRYHSDWLSMMYSRLLVARQLMSNDGLIFISIDDHEHSNLVNLCREVFGDENYIGTITRSTGTPTGGGFDILVNIVDYIVIFAKSEEAGLNALPFTEQDSSIYNEEDERGRYLTRSIRRTGGADRREDRPSMYYPIKGPDGIDVFPIGPGGYESRWICGPKKYNELLKEGLIEWKQIEDNGKLLWKPYQKYYLEGRKKQPSNLWTDVAGNKKATRDVRTLLEGKIFDSPKPVELIERCINIADEEGLIVLDFFAGSGTTAQAVMQLNQEDGGNRRFILVQLPEAIDAKHEAYKAGYRTISQITIERNKRVIEGYGDNPQPLDTGFKVYRLTKSHFPRAEFQPDPDKTNEENVELLKQYINEKEASFQITFDQDDVLDEVLLKHGFKLNYKLTKQEGFGSNTVYLVEEGDRKVYICLDTNISNETVDFFKTTKDVTFICLERALDTTKKWNLNHNLGERLKAL
jgi:adenine-specific DNA-methyltransferase